MVKYDYIIAGSGCAGRSLAVHMIPHLTSTNKKLLITDQSFSHQQSKTWCYWEEKSSLFDAVVYHGWNNLLFNDGNTLLNLDINPYTYKMIRSEDFYKYTDDLLHSCEQIDFLTGTVNKCWQIENMATLQLDDQFFSADFIFNSIPAFTIPNPDKYYYLLQHFRGWTIRSSVPVFDQNVATLMDFSVSQSAGTAFFYVLPFDANTAMIEYTVFSANELEEHQYTAAIMNYLDQHLNGSEYQVIKKEAGVIPMSTHPSPVNQTRIIYIGTAGGATKPSTGYTFKFIQRQCAQIMLSLQKGKFPLLKNNTKKRFAYYDAALLRILQEKELTALNIFSKMFNGTSVKRILQFLDNESSLFDEFAIFKKLPKKEFAKAFIQELSKR